MTHILDSALLWLRVYQQPALFRMAP